MLRTIKHAVGRCFRRLNNNRIARTLNFWSTLDPTPTAIDQKRVELYQTLTGPYYLPTDAPDDPVINSIRAGLVYDAEVVETARAHISPGSVVLDLGANFGQMAVLFSQFTGPQGEVHCFEADPFIHELLKENLAANHCQNVTTHFGAVHDQANQELFYPQQDFKRFGAYGSYGVDPNAITGRKIPTLTIDSLNIQTPISFMKVDIQGSDLFAMRGAIETIKRHRMPIIFEFEQQFQTEFHTSFQDYIEFVDAISYRFETVIMGINYLIMPR